MTDRMTLREAVKIFFATSLNRDAGEEEVQIYERKYLDGSTLKEIAIFISESPEAQEVQLSKFLANTTLSELLANKLSLNSTTLIRGDDVMNAISKTYEFAIGRHPLFAEVYDHFIHLKSGETLTSILTSIFLSKGSNYSKTISDGFPTEERETIKQLLLVIYNNMLERSVNDNEVDIWVANHVSGVSIIDIILSIHKSEEAKYIRDRRNLLEFPSGVFVQMLYELFQRRGATPSEIDHYRRRIVNGSTTAVALIRDFFVDAARRLMDVSAGQKNNDPAVAHLFGATPRVVTVEEWQQRITDSDCSSLVSKKENVGSSNFARFTYCASKQKKISIITSLYKGAAYIDTFLENITGQTVFADSELIIIDANSPEGEGAVIEKYRKRFKNIKYKRLSTRVGIYEAWNMGIKMASGLYCTNANLDDCRREDSLEIQASTLDALSFVDVVYQDVLYSFRENIKFADYQRWGFSTNLPIISRYNLMEFNSPHNAPMWRKDLHDDVGLFDSSLQSAGDYDFWLRCHLANKTFFKINDPHVGYFVNPNGLSTREDTKGGQEAAMLSLKYYRRIISDNLTCDNAVFTKLLDSDLEDNLEDDRYNKVQVALRQLSKKFRGKTQ